MATAAFAQVRARIGASRVAIAATPQGTPLQKMSSELQARSLITLLKDKATALTDDEKAQVAAAVATTGFLQDDACAILATMNNNGGPKRREAQDMLTFPHFVAKHEWDVAEHNFDSAMQTFSTVLIHRFGCLCPDEYTLRRLAALCMVCSADRDAPLVFSHEAKAAALKTIKSSYRKSVRVVKKNQKDNPSSLPYINKLPTTPAELEKLHPSHIEHFKIEGCWFACPIDMHKVFTVESFFSCRETPTAKHEVALATTSSMNPMTMMAQMMMATMQHMQRRQADDSSPDECKLRYPKKRCLADLLGGSTDQAPKRTRSSSSWIEEGAGERAPPIRSRSSWDLEVSPQQAPPAGALKPATSPRAEEAETTSPAEDAGEDVKPAAAQEPEPSSSPMSADSVLDALMEREQEKADAKKAEAQELRMKKAEAKIEEKEAAAAAAAAAKSAKLASKPGEGLAKAGAAKLATKVGAGLAAKANAPKLATMLGASKLPIKPGKPIASKACTKNHYGISHEASRSQVLARASVCSKTFKYGQGRAYATYRIADAAARKWFAAA